MLSILRSDQKRKELEQIQRNHKSSQAKKTALISSVHKNITVHYCNTHVTSAHLPSPSHPRTLPKFLERFTWTFYLLIFLRHPCHLSTFAPLNTNSLRNICGAFLEKIKVLQCYVLFLETSARNKMLSLMSKLFLSKYKDHYRGFEIQECNSCLSVMLDAINCLLYGVSVRRYRD